MSIPIFQVDAFAEEPFKGNPAGVCLLPGPADAAWMQNVAAEMNLADFAYIPGPGLLVVPTYTDGRIAAFTVGYQAVRSAVSEPVESLRYQ